MRILFTFLVVLVGLTAQASRPTVPTSQPTLEFIENRGQWASPVRYAAALPGGGQLFAERDGLRLALLEPGALAHPGHAPDSLQHLANPARTLRGHAFDLRFVAPAPSAHLVPMVRTTEHRNYFRGNDPARWASDVRSYHELHYADLWPGIEARLYENEEQRLEYDFTVDPGASPAAIALRHAGAKVTLDQLGNLLLTTSVGVVRELAPQAWQLDESGSRQPVACRYQLDRAGTVRFVLGSYDATRALVIDPTVVFSGYTGSTATNWGFTAAYDAQGNLYSGGIAFSLGYPTSPGAIQTTFGGIIDIALIKYDVTQKGAAARSWATYLGGDGGDFPHSLVVDAQGELLMLGSTASTNFPTTAGAIQRTFAGGPAADPFGYVASGGTFYQLSGSDIVVCRLSATGTVLRGSTYLGGSDNDGLLPLVSSSTAPQLAHNSGDAFRGDILVDAAGSVYVASCTSSRNFPLVNGFQNTYRGGTSDGVVFKLKSDLTAMLWGGYLGGSASDAVYSLQLAPTSGDVYVAGGTLSTDLPATTGSLNPALAGNVDGFVTRIAANGSSVMRTSYLGTSAYDQAYFVQLGGDGGVYVLGQTMGTYPTTTGLYKNTNGRQFIHKLAPDLSSTQLATVFGAGRASVDISPTAFLVDHCERVYVCGWGGGANLNGGYYPYLTANNGCSTNGLPTTAFAVQSTTDGSDFYLAQFSAGLANLAYGTFLGGYSGPSWGEHVDGGTSRFDPRGVVYQAVCTCGSTAGFPVPLGANYYYSTSSAGNNCNNAAFVLNFQPDVADVGPPLTVCLGGPTALSGTPNGGVWTGTGVSGSVATGFAFTPPAVGTYPLTYTVTTGVCSSSATRQVTAVAVPTASISTSLQTAYCAAVGVPLPLVPLVGTPVGGTFSGVGVYAASSGTGQVFNPNTVSGTAEITYTYTIGCAAKATRQVQVIRTDAGAAQTLCTNSLPIVLVGSPTGGVWTGAGVSGSVAAGFVFTPSAVSAGIISLTYTRQSDDKSCAASSVRLITVASSDNVALTPLPTPMCVSTTTNFPLVATPAGGYWLGRGVSRSSTGDYYFQATNAGLGTFTLTYYVGSGTVCATQRTMSVTVVQSLSVVVPADTLLCPGTTQPFALRSGSPAGGTWAGPGVSGSAAAGFMFTPPVGFTGPASLTYTVTTSGGGCTGSATRRVGLPVLPTFRPSWVPVACVEDRQAPLVVHFTDAGNNSATRWDFGDGSPVATGPDVLHTYQQAGYYQPRVSLRYLNALCETTAPLAAIDVQNQPIPNIITPNGDALNQAFHLPPSCIPRLEMFSRWGQRVFEAAVYHNDWDATGHPAGIYYYLLTYPDGHRVKGWLEVMK